MRQRLGDNRKRQWGWYAFSALVFSICAFQLWAAVTLTTDEHRALLASLLGF